MNIGVSASTYKSKDQGSVLKTNLICVSGAGAGPTRIKATLAADMEMLYETWYCTASKNKEVFATDDDIDLRSAILTSVISIIVAGNVTRTLKLCGHLFNWQK